MSGRSPRPATGPAVALYLDPPSHHFLADRLFDARTNPLSGHDPLAPFVALRERLGARGIPVHTADLLPGGPGERKLYVSFGEWRRSSEPGIVPSALFALECPIVEPSLYRQLPALQRRFRRLFTWAAPSALLPFTRGLVASRDFRIPYARDRADPAIWARRDRRFLTLINANKLPRLERSELYGERRRAVAFFHRYGEIDLYGPHWDGAPRRVGRSWRPATARRLGERLWELRQRLRPDPVYAACAAAWRGVAASKLETLGGYRFALCFENAALPGYLTEKLFDCFVAGTVPVYLGAPDVAEWVPEECFVDRRRFRDDAELRSYLRGLSEAAVEDYRERARAFLASARFDPFRVAAFLALFDEIVREDAGCEV